MIYSNAGAYFVTVCTQKRECLFGEIRDGAMKLHGAGKTIAKWWKELTKKFRSVEVHEYVVMPNHFHGIITIVGADLRVCPDSMGAHTGAPLQRIIQWFKTMTTNDYIRGIKQNGWQPFSGKLWQRNYYEHIIRNDDDLNRIREYIVTNPAQWAFDDENPNHVI